MSTDTLENLRKLINKEISGGYLEEKYDEEKDTLVYHLTEEGEMKGKFLEIAEKYGIEVVGVPQWKILEGLKGKLNEKERNLVKKFVEAHDLPELTYEQTASMDALIPKLGEAETEIIREKDTEKLREAYKMIQEVKRNIPISEVGKVTPEALKEPSSPKEKEYVSLVKILRDLNLILCDHSIELPDTIVGERPD